MTSGLLDFTVPGLSHDSVDSQVGISIAFMEEAASELSLRERGGYEVH